MPIYSCGCVNELDPISLVLRSISKCNFHMQWSADHPQGESLEYYKDYFDDRGIPRAKRLIDELKEALLNMHLPEPYEESVLELGCGLGAYVPLFLKNKCLYTAIERSLFSAEWTRNNYDVLVYEKDFDTVNLPDLGWDLVFGAHIFEHLKDGPGGLEKAYGLIKTGGRLMLIVPDDGDPTNPDHQWFFTETSLIRLLQKIGFKNVQTAIFKRVPQENFIYCVAEK